ncbi:MAG TPA: ABC transporter substrate-binding protein [Candidatus Eremiobacteraceae bacterium]|nr:ABC transporter substrate-binding protein [Candidatus Eremiobacteraceae bacterium]
MRRLCAAALAAAMLLSAGCSSGPPPERPLIFARNKDAVSLDPAIATDGLSFNIARVTLQGLTHYHLGGFTPEPQLATSWTSSKDGTSWVFTLRRGVRFQDGTPFDAAAVKYNFDRWMKDDPHFSYFHSQFGSYPTVVRSVKVLRPDRIRIDLRSPIASFIADLAMPAFSISSPTALRNLGQKYYTQPSGTGPYEVSEWVKDDHITLKAWPGYWGPRPKISTIIVRDIPDPATAVLEVEKGDIDGLEFPRPDDLPALAANPKLHVYRQPPNNLMYLSINDEMKPFDDVRVRRAINEAIDTRAIVKNFYDAAAITAREFVPPAVWPHGVDTSYRYDPNDARRLLALAGYPHGFSVPLWYMTLPRPYVPEPQRVAEAIQSDLRAVGISTTLSGLEWGMYLVKVGSGEHHLAIAGWTGDDGDPDNFLYPLLDKDSAVAPDANNTAFWMDEPFHKMMLEGRSTLDRAAREAIYRRALLRVRDQAPVVAIVHTSPPIVFASDVRGYVPSPDSGLHFETMYFAGGAHD